jgi:hypothetical protein
MRSVRYFICTFLFLSINYILNLVLNWPLLAMSGTKGATNFSDLSTTLKQVNCGQSTCPDYIYGDLFARLARGLNLSAISIDLMAYILTGLFILSVSLIASSAKSKVGVLAINTVGVSPSTLLLLERANIDIFIFVLCFLASILAKGKLKVISVLLLALSTFIKFYPLLAFLHQSFLTSKIKSSNLKRAFIGLLAVGVTIITIANVVKESSSIPLNWDNSFGLSIGILWLSFIFKEMTNLNLVVIGSLIPMIGFSSLIMMWLLIRVSRLTNVSLRNTSISKDPVFLVGLTCYVLGISYDYRLVFVLIPCALMLENSVTRPGKRFILLIIASFFTTTNFGVDVKFFYPGIQLIGDISLFILILTSIFQLKSTKGSHSQGRE